MQKSLIYWYEVLLFLQVSHHIFWKLYCKLRIVIPQFDSCLCLGNTYKTWIWDLRQQVSFSVLYSLPTNIYMFKVNNRNTSKRCKICSKLTIKTPERRHWQRSDVFFFCNFEHNSYLFLLFFLPTLNW